MIYLIKTAVFIDGNIPEEDKSVMALKIGYSRDERGDGRFNDYVNNGLNIRILKTIPGGSYTLENKLHHLFKDFNIPSRSREWFYYEKEIVNIFNSCNTETDLYRLFGISNEEELLKEKLDSRSDRYKLNYELSLKIDKFGEDYGNTKNHVYKALEYLQKLTTFTTQMKSICDNAYDLSQEDFEVFLKYAPSIMADFYNLLGQDRCKALRYRKDLLQEEYNNLLKKQSENLSVKIIERFTVGERYSMSDIKQKLIVLYEEVGLTGKPTAKLLESVFEIKTCNIPNPENPKKRDKGFEIIALRNEQNSN